MCDRISAAIADEPAYSNVHTIGNGAPQATPQATSQGSSQAASTDASTSSALIRAKPSLLRTATTGFAIAASVALVTVVGLSSWQGGALQGFNGQSQSVAVNSLSADVQPVSSVASNEATEAFSQQVPGVPLPEVDFVANSASYWVSPETTERSRSENRLSMFLSQHIENSPSADHQGMFPYSRLVGYQQQQVAE